MPSCLWLVGRGYSGLFNILRGDFHVVPTMSISALQRRLHQIVHVDENIAAQLRLEKKLQLEDFILPGVGNVTSTPTSAIDSVFLFVDPFQLLLSFQTERCEDGDLGAPTPCRDRIRLFQNGSRSLMETLCVYVGRLRRHLIRGNYADQVDTDIREAFEEDFQQIFRDVKTHSNRMRIRYRTAPPPPRELMSMPATRFPGTKALPHQGNPTWLLQRSRVWATIYMRPPTTPSGTKEGKRGRSGNASAGSTLSRPNCTNTFLSRLIHFSPPRTKFADFCAGMTCTRAQCARNHSARHPNPAERWMSFVGNVPVEVLPVIAANTPTSRAILVKAPHNNGQQDQFESEGGFNRLPTVGGQRGVGAAARSGAVATS